MIVEPDFPDHWKTQLLATLVAGETLTDATDNPTSSVGSVWVDPTASQRAPSVIPTHLAPEGSAMLIVRLWAHCQQRRSSIFPKMTDAALKTVCRWGGDGARLREILIEAGFIHCEGSELVVHQWSERNGKLVRNWENGAKNTAKQKPSASQREPKHPVGLTQTTPKGGASRVEESRVPLPSPRGQGESASLADLKIRISAIFGRKRNWGQEEEHWLSKENVTAEEVALVEAWFGDGRGDDKARLPESPLTLLRSWAHNLDRARLYLGIQNGAEKKERPEPDGWRDWLAESFPKATVPERFRDLPGDLQREFHNLKGAAA